MLDIKQLLKLKEELQERAKHCEDKEEEKAVAEYNNKIITHLNELISYQMARNLLKSVKLYDAYHKECEKLNYPSFDTIEESLEKNELTQREMKALHYSITDELFANESIDNEAEMYELRLKIAENYNNYINGGLEKLERELEEIETE
jgi:hypothetical protein